MNAGVDNGSVRVGAARVDAKDDVALAHDAGMPLARPVGKIKSRALGENGSLSCSPATGQRSLTP